MTTQKMESYRRHLPHLHSPDTPLFLTFRLHGSLPSGREFPRMSSGKQFVAYDRLLASNRDGPLFLKTPEIAMLLVNAIVEPTSDYELHSWVVMPNHVHMLVTPQTAPPAFLRKLKGKTAHAANRLLGRTGPFWQGESYDHLVRNTDEFHRIQRYIDWNPVQAGLCRTSKEFCWSSVGRASPRAGL
jgi:REP element-mobilizing transposase RayT